MSMRIDTLNDKVKTRRQYEQWALDQPSKVKGILVPPSRAMTTVLGKRIHFINPKMAEQGAVEGICGAGAPNRQFPLGSVLLPLEGKNDQIKGEEAVIPIDCYKCMKLMYMNQFVDQGKEDQIPTRDFTPSDQQPDGHTWGIELSKEDLKRLLKEKKHIQYVLNKGELFVFYLKLRDPQGYRMRYHVKNKESQKFTSELIRLGLTVQTKKAPSEDAYKRRKEHVMIPQGRYGLFGGKHLVKTTVDGEEDAFLPENFLAQKYGYTVENADGSINLDWIESYFKSKKNKWKVGQPRRRTQQFEPDFRESFVVDILNLLNIGNYKDLDKKQEKRINLLLKQVNDTRKWLRRVPLKEFLKLKFKSSMGTKIYMEVEAERREEVNAFRRGTSETKKNPKPKPKQLTDKVLRSLDQMKSFDKLWREMEKSNVQNRRSS